MTINVTTELTTYLREQDAADLPAALLDRKQMDVLIARISAEARAAVPDPDVSTEKGRAAIRSNAFKVVKSRTALEAAAKAETEQYRVKVNAINAVRRMAVETLEQLEEELRKPLTDWEDAEKARQAELQDRLDAMFVPPTLAMMSAAAVAELIAGWETVDPADGTWDECAVVARHKLDEVLAVLRSAQGAAVKREAEAEELAKLRAEKARREAEVAASERARWAAEAEADRERKQREAEERAAEAARAKAEREAQERIDAAERAARTAVLAAAREQEAAAAREAQAARDAEAAQQKAVEAERERVAEERRQQAEAEERRRQDKLARATALVAMIPAIESLIPGDQGTAHAIAEIVAEAIVDGKIPFVVWAP